MDSASRPAIAFATLIGAAGGVVFAASPLSALACVWLAAVCAWAVRGLGPRERAVVLVVLGAAIAVRLGAIAVLYATTPHDRAVSFFWDGDGPFLKRRAALIRNIWAGMPVHDFFGAFNHTYGWTAYVYLLAYVQHLLGPAPYGIHVMHVMWFVTAAVILFRVVRPAYGAHAAVAGLCLMLFLPTLIAWSMAALKESFYLLLCTVSLVTALACVRARSWRWRALAAVGLAVSLAANAAVRAGAVEIVGGGLVAGALMAALLRAPGRAAAAAVAVTLVALVGAWRMPAAQARVVGGLKHAAQLHMGNVQTEGHAYKLLDQRIYSSSSNKEGITAVPTMTAAELARFTVRALASIVVVPLPWQARTMPEIALLAQQVLWYLMVVFACIGLATGVRRDALLTLAIAGIAAVGAAVIALNNGNIGTMVRFRDTIVPFVAILSGLGVVTAIQWFAPLRHAPTPVAVQ